MISRVYLNNDGMFHGQLPRIEYYDYDLINDDGTSKLYRFEFSKEVFNRDIKGTFIEEGRDGCDVVADMFAFYEGWNDLKSALEAMNIDFKYEEITLTREERLKIQERQYGEHRCVVVQGYVGFDNIDELNDLNEYEKERLRDLNENYKDVNLDIPFGWEEEDYKFLKDQSEYDSYIKSYYEEIGMTQEEVEQLYFTSLLEKLLGEKNTPEWCGLLEEIDGQLGGYENGMSDCSIFKKYRPNIKNYSEEEFMHAETLDDIPDDWQQFACACLKKMDESGWPFGGFRIDRNFT